MVMLLIVAFWAHDISESHIKARTSYPNLWSRVFENWMELQDFLLAFSAFAFTTTSTLVVLWN